MVGIVQLDPTQALERMRRGARLVDVRDSGERASGMAEGAIGVDRARKDDPHQITVAGAAPGLRRQKTRTGFPFHPPRERRTADTCWPVS